jgi:hypothetical protein
MKAMLNHSSATYLAETPHVNQTTRTALKRRAESVLNDKSIDAQSRAVIRYALEINDPWLADLVRHVDAGEAVVDMDFSEFSEDSEDGSTEQKIEALVELICRAGDEPETKISRVARAYGDARKCNPSKSTCKRGEALCFQSLRGVERVRHG